MNRAEIIERFLRLLADSVGDDTFVRLRLSGAAEDSDRPQKIQARLVALKAGKRLSFTLEYARRDETKNLAVADGLKWIRELAEQQYANAYLSTTRGDWQAFIPNRGAVRLVQHRSASSTPPSRAHDAARHYLLDRSAWDWLHALGVTDAGGRPLSQMGDKYRQINRYLEILSHLASDCGWLVDDCQSPDGKQLVIADMGCGKGYLTFGAWSLFRRSLNQPVRVIGVEQRPELVKILTQAASKIGAEGLEFVAGDIAAAQLPPLDALIALHACNTATDDAIRRGIAAGCRLIVVAPCCHKEVRKQLGRPEPLANLLRHGLMAERFAEWLTDGLRALYLEWAGYETKMIEFVASEHTPKNLMISAVLKHEPFANPSARDAIRRVKEFAGMDRFALDDLL